MMQQTQAIPRLQILVTVDKSYLPPLARMLSSYRDTHPGVATDVYIAHASLTEKDLLWLQEQLYEDVSENGDCALLLHGIRITESWFHDIPVLERLPKESFYRLLAFSFLPPHVDRCLYLDPDIWIRRSLLPLYTIDLGEAYLAASGHLYGWVNTLNKARLGVIRNERYINSGVMLLNLKQIRRDFTVKGIMDDLQENAGRLIMGDQDMVNLLFGQKAILVDEKIWNLDERTFRHNQKSFDLSCVERETAILHYNGPYKPWLQGYKGVLNRFYPLVENPGPAPKGKVRGWLRSLRRILTFDTRQRIVVFGFLGVLLVCLFSYLFFGKELLKIVSDPVTFRSWLDRFGVFDELIFILIRAAQTVIKFIPAEPLEIGSGYAWGALPGMLYCVIGNLIGTVVIWGLTKAYGKKVLSFFLPTSTSRSSRWLSVFHERRSLYALLFFLYLIPGSPKDGFTYFVGLLPVKFFPFLILTGIARMPSVLSSTLCGSALAEKRYLWSGLIFIVTIILAIGGGLLYRYYMKKQERQA